MWKSWWELIPRHINWLQLFETNYTLQVLQNILNVQIHSVWHEVCNVGNKVGSSLRGRRDLTWPHMATWPHLASFQQVGCQSKAKSVFAGGLALWHVIVIVWKGWMLLAWGVEITTDSIQEADPACDLLRGSKPPAPATAAGVILIHCYNVAM